MTRIVLADKNAEFFPVVFRLWRPLERDLYMDIEGERTMVAKMGDPDRRTFDTITLYRRVKNGPIETVGDKIRELKNMLINSRSRYTILNAPETDQERTARYTRDGLEVVAEANPIIISAVPPVAVDDEVVGVSADDGRIKSKKKSKKMDKIAA